MSVLEHETAASFDNLDPEGQAAELAALLDRMKPEATPHVGQKASGRAREMLLNILDGVPDRPRNTVSVVALSILGGLTVVGMGLGAAAVFAGVDSALFFGFAAAALTVMGVMLAPMPVSRKWLRKY